MKHYRIYLTVIVLVLASLACQSVGGGSTDTPTTVPPTSDAGSATQEPATQEPATQAPTSAPSTDNNASGAADTDFPMTDDASNVIEANGTLIFYTKMSQEDLMAFYRNEYKAKGYTEREILTVVSDGVFSMVFDGDPSGKAVVIQSVDMGDNRTITIRLEDV
ncbi:MAG TPA: hypothetical protein VKP08_01565 [Anaerolineales bacterium]|nr:hypothetical protein [Anaerolineales bacterium]